jgi:hypothetical protein
MMFYVVTAIGLMHSAVRVTQVQTIPVVTPIITPHACTRDIVIGFVVVVSTKITISGDLGI